jgi:hypothetical protein
MTLASADGGTARAVVRDLEESALRRLDAETKLSQEAIAAGAKRADEVAILSAWTSYYLDALKTTAEIEVGGPSELTNGEILAAVARLQLAGRERLTKLGPG